MLADKSMQEEFSKKTTQPSHPRQWRLMQQHNRRVEPAESVVRPEERADSVEPSVTYIGDAGVRQLAVPLVLDALDLAAVREDVDLAVDRRLLADALDFVARGEVHRDGVAGRGHVVRFALDLGEGGLQAVLYAIC